MPSHQTSRLALRTATAAAHERLHHIPVFQDLAEGRLDRAGYAALLRRLLGFHAAIEAVLAAAPSLAHYGIDLAGRRRAPLLRADLAHLGAPAEAPLAPVPRFAIAAEALGALYVTEGSTLGGRHLARGLDHILPAGEGRGFFLGHGARHGAMWAACCAAIEACGAEPGGLTGMQAGAAATFAAFEAWFA
ncbi:biliverdin-producing heme oxygenase [Belnapia sp. F-4-1]|uniref:biliverdin-producing heme oxygenase n=1 Tax=Belnapia sp. F-4-1 TaxID=1545443 RepID=UPI00068D48CF|nr:biliverdin-producing heme oxygenase [Belnapia sp. F-4-1]